MSSASTASADPRRQARELRPLIEAEADATDRALTLTEPLVDAFARTRLFHLMVPAQLGGLEADCDTILDVFEELAFADGSVGWSLMANASATSYVAFLEPAAAAQMVKDQPRSTIAGQFSPFAHVVPEEGGYSVSGHFQFGSGCAHARYLGGAGFLLGEGGTPRLADDGLPLYLCFFVPRERVALQGNWDVLGLRGTGSFDYEVPPQHVDAERTFLLFHSEVRSGGPLFRMGPVPLAGLGHAGWALGVARRALEEIVGVAAGGRARMGSPALRDQAVFQRELGRQEMALQSVRLLAHDAFGRCVRRLEAGDPMAKQDSDELMSAIAYLTEVAQEVTLFAYRTAGSQGLRNPSLVQRCFRDLFTGALHIYVDPRSFEEWARRRFSGA